MADAEDTAKGSSADPPPRPSPARGAGERKKPPSEPFPWGLIGLIALVLGIESIVARHELGLMSYVALNARYAVAEARTSDDCQVLCLGDSQVKFGLDPWTIEAGSGLRAKNLAIAGSPTPTS